MSGDVWRTYQLNCPEPREKSESPCAKCGLALSLHHLRFEVLNYDKAKDLWTLMPVQSAGFNPNASANTKSSAIRIPGRTFEKFMVYG